MTAENSYEYYQRPFCKSGLIENPDVFYFKSLALLIVLQHLSKYIVFSYLL